MIELKGPSVFEIKQFIQNNDLIEFYTINDKILSGRIIWSDDEGFHIKLDDGQELTIMKKSIVYYSKKVGE